MTNKITQLLFLGFLLIAINGCTDILDKEPLDQLTTENFYQTAQDAELGIVSAYSPMQGVGWYGTVWKVTEIPSDNTTTGGNDPDFSPIDNFTTNADNPPVADFWAEHYRMIAYANQVLDKVPAIDMDEEVKAGILGEAKFLRAFAYFDLVRIFGDVPIVTQVLDINSDFNIPRNPLSEVYDLIVADLEEAVASLPVERTNAGLGRATSGAAKALLMKVHLTMKNYDESMTLAREIIASGTYQLMDDFADNWLKETSDNNEESIFQIQYVSCGPGGTGNALQAFFAPYGQGITKNSDGWGSQTATSPKIDAVGTTIREVYLDTDERKYHTIMTPGDHYPFINPEDGGFMYPLTKEISRSGISIKKYVIGGGPDICFMSTPQNLHIIRYPDVLLSLAEAATARDGGLNVTPDVLEAFNAVRQRAGLDPVDVVTSELVLAEQRAEFAFENQRWFDLLRSGTTIDVMRAHGKALDEHNLLFPIPSAELAINPNLTQNPGY